MNEYNGQKYYDDRLFVLYLCKCTVSLGPEKTVSVIIHHEQSPVEYKWGLVTYKNCERYPAVKVDIFSSKENATQYIKKVEPTVPLISLQGKSPEKPLVYEEYLEWKKQNGWKEFNYKEVYSDEGENPREIMVISREQYLKAVHK